MGFNSAFKGLNSAIKRLKTKIYGTSYRIALYMTMRSRLNVQFILHREHDLFALEGPFCIVLHRGVVDVCYGKVVECMSGLPSVGKQKFSPYRCTVYFVESFN